MVFSASDVWINQVLLGDAAQVLLGIPDEVVHCIVTSPPYYQQRDYRATGQIGFESTPEMYIAALVGVFSQCRRVLRSDGTLWINLGDKYSNGDQLGLPWRVALALKENGWKLRSDIIWRKPNAMPSSVKNRPTTEHEYIFLLAKSDHYYYNADAIREPHVTFTEHSQMRGGRNHFGKRFGTPENGKNAGNPNLHNGRWDQAFHPLGRNRRTVWDIPLSKFRDAHFAVFPEKLVELCITAGCPDKGIVLDPFLGSGTTAVVAKRLGRNYIGIELNPEYHDMAVQRLIQPSML